jgi:hypothetical protein
MNLNITAHDTSQCSDQLIYLPGVGTPNGIRNADPVHADLVDGLVYRQQVDKV